MDFCLGKVIEFALSDREIAVRSFDEFLGEAPASEVGDEELVFGLFTDWFIFNYCTRRSLSYLNEYILVNPDNLDGAALSRLKDISQSHWYGGFEICSIKVGEYLDLEHLFSGKKIRVFDRLGSKNSPNEGVILCRVAKVEGHYCLVSGDPLLLPLNHTPRLKQMMKKKKVDFCSSPEMALKILLSPKSPAPEYFSLQDILRKRRELEKEYRNLCHQYKDLPSYEKLAKEIYEEEKEESFFDIVDSLFRTESAKKVFVDNGQVFQDLWNFLPHRLLRGKSPTEEFQKRRISPNSSEKKQHSLRAGKGKGAGEEVDHDFFDDCPICQSMKKAALEGRDLTYSELRESFVKAKEAGNLTGGDLPDDPNFSLSDFQHVIQKIGRNDLCPCGSGKRYKRCHGR